MAENKSVSERSKSGVVRVKLVDNVSDATRSGYDFTTQTQHALPSLAEVQRRFLAALHKDGYVPFDGDEDGTQFWRRPEHSSTTE